MLLAVCLPVMASGSTEVVSRQEAPAEGLKVNSSWKQIRSGDFVVASDASDLPAKLVLASETVQAFHWRLHEVVVTAVPSLEPPD